MFNIFDFCTGVPSIPFKGKARDKCPKQNWLQNELSVVIILYFIDKTL